METTKEKIAKLKKAIASPATPDNVKMLMENTLEDLKDKLAEEMSPIFTDYKGEQIMYEPHNREYFVIGNDEKIFKSLEDAKAFIDNPKGAINTEFGKMADAETKEDVIAKTLNLIKEQIGLDLKLDDYFTGLKKHNGEIYFNVDLGERVSESNKFDKLKRFADKYKLIKVEPNGVNKVAIFPANKELQKGIEVEQEHKDTLQKIAAGEITVPQAIEETAKTHIEENPKYYDELEKIEGGDKTDTEGVEKAMKVQFDLIKTELDRGKLKDKHVISVASMRVEMMLKENPSTYPLYVEKFLDLPKSVRNILNPFFGMFEGEHPSTMKWLKEQNKNVFDVVKVEEYSLPKTKVIQTKPDDKNFMDIHSDFVGYNTLRPVMMGTHFDENGVVSTNSQIMLITPYRGDVPKLEGNFCHTKKCIEENKENIVTDSKFPNWQVVIPKSNTEYNMNTAAVYDFIKNSTKYELMNAVTNLLVFKYGEEKIGFNAQFLIICINAMSELGHKELSIAIETSNRAALIMPKGRLQDVNNLKTDFALLMPMMLDTVVEYYGEFNLENSCYTDPNELTYCFDVEKMKVKKAEKKVKELEKKIEELTSAIEPMIKEKEFPSPEKQGMFKVIKGIFEGTEFFGRIDGDRVINEDSIGQSFPIANVKRIGYELGEGYSADFDFEGLLRTALRANTSWGVEALKKLHYSFEDNNYHTLGRPLWEAVKSLKLGSEPSAKLHLHEFHQAVQEELNDYLTPDVEGEEIDPNTLQPIAKEEVSAEPIDAVEAITDAVEEDDKASWEELKELAEAMIEVSKGKEKKEWIEAKELAEAMLAE